MKKFLCVSVLSIFLILLTSCGEKLIEIPDGASLEVFTSELDTTDWLPIASEVSALIDAVNALPESARCEASDSKIAERVELSVSSDKRSDKIELLLLEDGSCRFKSSEREFAFESDTVAESVVAVIEKRRANRIILDDLGFEWLDQDFAANVHTIETQIELASQVVLCTVKSIDRIRFYSQRYVFFYTVELNEILLDTSGKLNIGDEIPLATDAGILRYCDAYEVEPKSYTLNKLAEKYGELTEVGYVTSNSWDGIPIEPGRSYIFLLDDDYRPEEGLYIPCRSRYSWEYSGERLYAGTRQNRLELTKSELLGELKSAISKRTGLADELGYLAYTDRLEEIQRTISAEYPATQIYVGDNITDRRLEDMINRLSERFRVKDIREINPLDSSEILAQFDFTSDFGYFGIHYTVTAFNDEICERLYGEGPFCSISYEYVDNLTGSRVERYSFGLPDAELAEMIIEFAN